MKIRNSASLLLFSLIASLAAQSQGPPANSPPGFSTATRPGSIADSGALDYFTEMDPASRAGGVLLGKVALPEGELTWQPIPVAVLCQGKVMISAGSDAKGNFALSSAHLPGVLNVDDDPKRQMETHLDGCTVKAMLPGFESSQITLSLKNFHDTPFIGTLELRRSESYAGTSISTTVQTASPQAIGHFSKAHSALVEHDSERAERELKKAVQSDPKFAEAWFQLGRLQLALEPGEARGSFQRAADTDANFVLPRLQLMSLAMTENNWTGTAELAQQIVKLDPVGSAEFWYGDSLAQFNLKNYPGASADAERSLALDPQHTILKTEQVLAVSLAQQHRYAEALSHLRNLLTYLPAGPNADLVKRQVAQLEQIKEK